jgi:hypothetical protein
MSDTTNGPFTVAGLMELVSEYGQCRWSEGSSGATYFDPLGERRSREEAADLYKQIEECVVKLASPSPAARAQPWQPIETAPRDGTEFVWLRRITVVAVGKLVTQKDGNAWMAALPGFTNIQECETGWGDTEAAAVADLLAKLAGMEGKANGN